MATRLQQVYDEPQLPTQLHRVETVPVAVLQTHFLALMLAAFKLVFVAAAFPESHIQPTWGTSNSASTKGASVRRLPALMQLLGALKPGRHSWECQQVA